MLFLLEGLKMSSHTKKGRARRQPRWVAARLASGRRGCNPGWQFLGWRDNYTGMEYERRLFEDLDPAAEEAALQRARDDIAAGRCVPHEEVAKWLRTWGTPDEKPMPKEWRR